MERFAPLSSMPSKRFESAKTSVTKNKVYPLAEAITLVKSLATAKFPESVELHMRLGIDPTKGEQQVRGTVALPHGTGKTKRVVAFVEAEKEADAKTAGADLVGGEELIKRIASSGVIEFDVAVATPVMMPKLAALAKILGPKGLMPNPKTDTINPNIAKIVQEQKAGKISFKNDATGNIHQLFGKTSFSEEQLLENLNLLIETIKKMKPSSAKGIYIRNAVICSTMGPGIKIEVAV